MAAPRKDMLIDDDFDLIIVNGDLSVGHSDNQHIQFIALSNPGEWKQTPVIGVAIGKYLKGPSNQVQHFVKNLKQQLKLDGYGDSVLTLKDGMGLFEILTERIV